MRAACLASLWLSMASLCLAGLVVCSCLFSGPRVAPVTAWACMAFLLQVTKCRFGLVYSNFVWVNRNWSAFSILWIGLAFQ